MKPASRTPDYQESRIEDEPILGPVLVMKNGFVQPLSFLERLMVTLRLTNAKTLEQRYLRAANS